MKKFFSQMKTFSPSYATSVSSFFATVRDLLIGMSLGRCLVVFMIFMSLLIVFGNRGLVDNYMMNEKLTALKKSNEDVALENQDLKRNITLLRGDLSYIEMVSRNELGMVRKGDLVYRYAQ